MLKTVIKIISKLFSFLGGVLVTLIVVTTVFMIYHIHTSRPVPEDVVKRLASPNREWAAFLISTNYSSERNIDVAVLPYEFIHRHLKFSDYVNNESAHLFHGPYFNPDFKVNLHENIEWSEDSSLLILTVDFEHKPFKWAYDFNTRKEVTDPNLIESLWHERNHINNMN